MKNINQITDDQSGATAIEYGLFAALLSIAMLVSYQGFGAEFKALFQTSSSAMQALNS